MITRLTLVAHAATPAQRHLLFPDDGEPIESLDPATIAGAMRQVGRFTEARRGPERRAAETADALGVPASPLAQLGAWYLGTWTGRSVADVAQGDPDAFGSWRTDPDATPHDGESLNGLLGRVGTWLDQREPDAAPTLVIADPAVVRAAIVRALDAGVPTFWHIDIRPLSFTVMQHTGGEWRVRAMGAGPGAGPHD